MNKYYIFVYSKSVEDYKSHFDKHFYPIDENHFFVKTKKKIHEINNILGFNKEVNNNGFAIKIQDINGWYDGDLWDWME